MQASTRFWLLQIALRARIRVRQLYLHKSCVGSQALLRARDKETQEEVATVRLQLEEAHDQLDHFQRLAEDAQVNPC